MAPPTLQPSGAGLPFFPRFYLRWFGRWSLRRKFTWDMAPVALEAAAVRLYETANALPDDALRTRVLVPPMNGLEDSSRYWSPAMVLQHLVMTGDIFSEIILQLSRGEPVTDRRGPGDVKPAAAADRTDVEAFRALHSGVGERLRTGAGPDRDGAKFPHPWFGPLTARDWFGLFATHLLIHERQLKAILNARQPIDRRTESSSQK